MLVISSFMGGLLAIMAELWDQAGLYLSAVFPGPLTLTMRLAPIYVLSCVVIAYTIWRLRGRSKPFWAWAFPKEIYFHRSSWVDLQIYLVGRIVAVSGLVGRVAFPTVVATYTIAILIVLSGGEHNPPPNSFTRLLLTTLLIFLVADFCAYWVHRLHHQWRIIWPFHSVHHSAEVLTPLTVYRIHPVYGVLSTLFRSVPVGLMQGIVIFAVMGQPEMLTIGGANVLYVMFSCAGANLRHSHIWLSFGPLVERIIISPAQHQIHHSLAVEHHNKNYGENFAIWDWMFGTLYIPEQRVELRFGLADQDGQAIEQPHPTLASALIEPFRASLAAVRSEDPNAPATEDPPAARGAEVPSR